MKESKLTLVLMAGLSGSGKTTLAVELSHKLQWFHIYKDRYREVLLKQGLSKEKAGWVAYELAFDIARKVLAEQQSSVILDSSALHSFVLETVLDIVSNVPSAQLKIILCVTNRDLRKERLQKRPLQESDNRVDPNTIEDYLSLFEHLPSDKLILDTASSPEECLKNVKEYLMR